MHLQSGIRESGWLKNTCSDCYGVLWVLMVWTQLGRFGGIEYLGLHWHFVRRLQMNTFRASHLSCLKMKEEGEVEAESR
jgi:hypothetical protein